MGDCIMGNRLKKAVLICFFLLGLAVFCYPYAPVSYTHLTLPTN